MHTSIVWIDWLRVTLAATGSAGSSWSTAADQWQDCRDAQIVAVLVQVKTQSTGYALRLNTAVAPNSSSAVGAWPELDSEVSLSGDQTKTLLATVGSTVPPLGLLSFLIENTVASAFDFDIRVQLLMKSAV